MSITGIDVDPQYLYDVLTELKSKNYIRYLSLTSGDHAIVAIIWAKDSDDMAKIHKEISSLSGVKKVCPSIILDVIKE
ncbi:MAG: Lrp/AsnC ligand binding domain-containing protein [Sulfolobales archaeon]